LRHKIITGEFYHVYNRGVDKRIIYNDHYDSARFLESMREFNVVESVDSIQSVRKHNRVRDRGPTSNRLVNVVSYCLNPNHFHFLLEQIEEGGISEFMKRIGCGYTLFFNKKYSRSGALFQGKYKYKHIPSDDYLKYLSVYVNLNDKVHNLHRDRGWTSISSYAQYIDLKKSRDRYDVENKEAVLSLFKSINAYRRYSEEVLVDIILNKKKYKGML